MPRSAPPLADLRIAIRPEPASPLVLGAHASLTKEAVGGLRLIVGSGAANEYSTRHGSGVHNRHNVAATGVSRELTEPIDFVRDAAHLVEAQGFAVGRRGRTYRPRADDDVRRTAILVGSDVESGFGFECWVVDPRRGDLLLALLCGDFDPDSIRQTSALVADWVRPTVVLRSITLTRDAVNLMIPRGDGMSRYPQGIRFRRQVTTLRENPRGVRSRIIRPQPVPFDWRYPD